MTRAWWRRAAVLGAGVAGLLATGPATAGAGGVEWMYPVRDRYEPGQDVLMVGYTLTAEPGDGGPYYAWLRVDPAAEARGVVVGSADADPPDVRVAPVVIEATVDDPAYGRRASISFTLPDDLPAGHYSLVLCDDPCTRAPGLLAPEVLSVGVPPEYPIVRIWPATEPAIRWLGDDARLYAPDGQEVTAADYRASRLPSPIVAATPPAPSVAAPGPPVASTTTAARDEAPEPEAPRRPASAADGGGEGWATHWGWLAGLAGLALASALLVARARGAHRAELASDRAESIAAAECDGSESVGPPGDEANLVRR